MSDNNNLVSKLWFKLKTKRRLYITVLIIGFPIGFPIQILCAALVSWEIWEKPKRPLGTLFNLFCVVGYFMLIIFFVVAFFQCDLYREEGETIKDIDPNIVNMNGEYDRIGLFVWGFGAVSLLVAGILTNMIN